MINQPIDAWFWILVGFAGGIVTIGLLCLSVFAFANWRRKVIDANADPRDAPALDPLPDTLSSPRSHR